MEWTSELTVGWFLVRDDTQNYEKPFVFLGHKLLCSFFCQNKFCHFREAMTKAYSQSVHRGWTKFTTPAGWHIWTLHKSICTPFSIARIWLVDIEKAIELIDLSY